MFCRKLELKFASGNQDFKLDYVGFTYGGFFHARKIPYVHKGAIIFNSAIKIAEHIWKILKDNSGENSHVVYVNITSTENSHGNWIATLTLFIENLKSPINGTLSVNIYAPINQSLGTVTSDLAGTNCTSPKDYLAKYPVIKPSSSQNPVLNP